MVARAAVDERVGAARVVAQHAAQTAAVARRGLRTEEQTVGLQGKVQLIAHHTGLHTGPSLFDVDFQDVVPVAADVGHDARSHHLPGNAGAAGAGYQVGVLVARRLQQLLHMVHALGIGHPVGYLAVDGGISRIGYLVDAVGINLHECGTKKVVQKLAYFLSPWLMYHTI